MKEIYFLLFFLCFLSKSEYASQLTENRFPDPEQSSREFVNNKRLFKAYKNQELKMTIINSGSVKSAVCTINGKNIDLSQYLKPDIHEFTIDITSYIRNGNDNTLSIQEIKPDKSYFDVYIPYPFLTAGTPQEVGFDPQKLAKVDAFIENEVKQGFPGAGLIIAKQGKIIYKKTFGYARKYNEDGKLIPEFEKLKDDTMFDMASNTKMFATNFAIMSLFYQDKLHYLNHLTKYIPEYKGTDKKGQKREDRLIFDFLTHTAGYEPDPLFFNPKKIPPEEYSQNKAKTEEIILKIHGFQRPRGGDPIYSDVDYMLLGILVEHLSNKQLDEYAEQYIYKKLGLTHSCFNPLKKGFKRQDCAATEIDGNTGNHTNNWPNIRKNVLQCEVHDPKSWYCMQGVSGHAGLFSSLDDMAVLSQILLNKGGYGNNKFWDRDTQDLFTKPYDVDNTFGLGWRRQGNEDLQWHFSKYASYDAIGHTGWTGTVTVIDPKHDLSIILLTNKKHSLFINGNYEGDKFQTGQYGDVMQLIYEAFLDN